MLEYLTRCSDLLDLSLIKLVIVDEIHLISDPNRGPILECVLSRLWWFSHKSAGHEIRFIAASATLPNAEMVTTTKQFFKAY